MRGQYIMFFVLIGHGGVCNVHILVGYEGVHGDLGMVVQMPYMTPPMTDTKVCVW